MSALSSSLQLTMTRHLTVPFLAPVSKLGDRSTLQKLTYVLKCIILAKSDGS